MIGILKAIRQKCSFYDFGFCLSVLFFFVLLPVLVWFFNPDDSKLSSTVLLKLGLIISCILCFSYFLLNSILKIPLTIKKFFTAVALFLFVMTFFFPSDADVIDGFKKDLSLSLKVYIDLLKHIIVLSALLVFVFYKKTTSLAKTCLTGCALVGAAFILYAYFYGAFYVPESTKMLWKTFEADQKDPVAFIEFGTEKNVIIIVWDGLEGKIAEDIFAGNQAAQDMFDGFMFFPNAISSAPLTTCSLPSMYSGKFHAYNTFTSGIVRKTMYSDSFFLDAKKNGFKVACKGIVKSVSIGEQKNFEDFHHTNLWISNKLSHNYKWFLNACSKRVTPVLFNQLFGFLINAKRELSAYLPRSKKREKSKKKLHRSWAGFGIPINQFRRGNFPDKLTYYHSTASHEPYYNENELGYSRELAQSVFSDILLKNTTFFFSKLKQLDIYDSSLIFVIADHGSRESETSVGIKVGNSPFDLSHKGFGIFPAGAYNPLFMVKKPFARGPLITLQNPAMLTDIRSVISAYIKGDALDNETLFNLDHIRQRDISLIIKVNSKTDKSLEPHIFKKFTGSLQDIPGHLTFKK